jgi:phospholipase C
MDRRGVLLFWCLLLCAAGLLVYLGGCGGTTSTISNPPPSSKIKHVVVIFQENRSTDNLFGGDQALIAAGADLASSGLNSLGQTIPLTPVALANDYDTNHAHNAFVQMYDNGKMDGADLIKVQCSPGATDCPDPNLQFKYVQASDVAPYYALAEQYTFADHMFQTNQGPSFPAHQFILSGTSAPTASSNLFAAENPQMLGGGQIGIDDDTGCTAPSSQFVRLIDPSGDETQTQYPCFDHPTLTDLLEKAQLTWRYYTPMAGSIWTAPNAIQHICGPNSGDTACTGPDWTTHVFLNQTQVLTDIANGQLASVSWVIPSGQSSDHPASNDGSGPSWVASVVNAIGQSSYWSDTAIFISWDDWGGWYDHVAPTIYNSYEYGFRVPLIVVSPYAKAAYISHVTHDFGSVLKFIETNFGIGSLGYADSRADDLSDCFDFSQTPINFQPIPTPLDARHFLNDKTPPTEPDDD